MRDQYKIILLGGLISCFTMFGCAKDKTADEARQQKVDRQLALYKSISAVYRGTLVNQNDGTSMGAIEIDFSPQNMTINSSDNTSTAAQVILQGKVTITNDSQSAAVIQTASYFSSDYSTNGSFSGNISIPIAANGSTPASTALMVISGTINGGNFNGQISLQNQVGIVASFNTVKDAAASPVVVTSATGSSNSTQIFSGFLQDLPGTSALMTIRKIVNSSSENFLNNFSLQKSVGLQLSFQVAGGSIDGVPFNSAQLDEQSGVIHAQSNYTGDVNAATTLDCLRKQLNGQLAWHCVFTSNYNGLSHSFDAVEVKK